VRGRFSRCGRGGRRPVRIRLIGGRDSGTRRGRCTSLVRRLLFHSNGSVDGSRRPVGSAVERRHYWM